jgi:hypothetical protein
VWCPTVLLSFTARTGSCAIDFRKEEYFHRVIKGELRIFIKDDHRKRKVRIVLFPPPVPCRQFLVRMNGTGWAATGEAVSLTRLATGLGESLVRAGGVGPG